MTFDVEPIIIALITVAGGSLVGLAALRKSGREADKYSAEATFTIVGGAKDVVAMLREQVAEQERQQEAVDERLSALEQAVTAWDGWADKVMAMLDRALAFVPAESRDTFQADIEQARNTRPARFRAPSLH